MATRRRRLNLEALEDRTVPATFVVDRLTDSAPSTGQGAGLIGDLRFCLTQANALAGSDTITFTVNGTIGLAAALPNITDALIIDGPGSDASSIRIERSSASNFRIFNVIGTNASFSDLTIANGYADDLSGGGILFQLASGSVTRCVLTGNRNDSGAGVGVRNSTVGITDTTFDGNSSAANVNGQSRGAGLYNLESTLTVDRCTFSNNTATFGGGFFQETNGAGSASSLFTNCTITGNSAIAAVYLLTNTGSNALEMDYCTVAGNSNGGVYAAIFTPGSGSLELLGSVFANNNGSNLLNNDTANTTFTSLGSNVSDQNSTDLSDSTDLRNATVLLGPLRANGGLVQTRALLPGSAGLDRPGSSSPPTDARSVSRPQGASADAGAFEARAYSLAATSGSQFTQSGYPFSSPVLATLTEGGNPLPGAVITFSIAGGSTPGGVSFAGGTYTATTDASGVATVPASAFVVSDTARGFYTLTASTAGGQTATYTLTVGNLPPDTVSLNVDGPDGAGVPSGPEGKPFVVSFMFNDPSYGTGSDARAHTATINWGDGTMDTVVVAAGQFAGSASHIYGAGLPGGSPSTPTISVFITDASGDSSAASSRTVTVRDNVPVVNAGGDASYTQGEAFSRGGSFTYDGSNSFTGTVDFGDGTDEQTLVINSSGSGGTFTLSHTYAEAGTYTVHVEITDGHGAPGVAEFTANVLSPFAVFAGDGQTAQAGSAYSIPLQTRSTTGGQGVQGDVITFTIDGGDTPGSATFPDGTATFVVSSTNTNGIAAAGPIIAGDFAGTYTVTASNAAGQKATFTFNVTNAAPSVVDLSFAGTTSGPGGESIPEGQTLTLNGTIADPGDGRSHTVDIYWGEDGGGDSGPGSTIIVGPGITTFSVTHVYTVSGGLPATAPTALNVTVFVYDASGASAFAQRPITVTDNVPAVDAGQDEFFTQGEAFSRVGSFSYTGTGTFTGTVDFGDGTMQALVINPDDSGGTFTLSHTYADADTYNVLVTVDDGRGTPGTATFTASVFPAIAVVAGDGQATQAGTPFSTPLQVRRTQGGQPPPPEEITFSISGGSTPGGVTFAGGDSTYAATTDASGIATVPASAILVSDAARGFYTVTASTAGGQTATFTLAVGNFPPHSVSLTVDGPDGAGMPTGPEGKPFTLSFTFNDPGFASSGSDARAHTATINWGDGTISTVLVAAGAFSGSASHVYGAGLPGGSPSTPTISVFITDASGDSSAAANRTITVRDNVPVVNAGHDDFYNQGAPFSRIGSFFYDGSNAFTGTVEYGDGTGLETLILNADRTFTLSHTYVHEGTYVVRVEVNDSHGTPGRAAFEADVLLPMVKDAAKGYVGPQGGSATVTASGVTGTLTTAGGRNSAIIVARVPDRVADAQDGNFVVGTGTGIGGAFDVRTINVGPRDYAVVTFTYFNDDDDAPTLYYFDRATRQEIVIPPSAYKVDLQAHTITIMFTDSSFVRLDQLRGTVFTITVPLANPAVPTLAATGFTLPDGQASSLMLVSASTGPGGGAGTGTGPGGGSRSQETAFFDTESLGGSSGEVPDKEEEPLLPPKKADATSGLPAVPKASISVPGVTLTAPQPRRFDLGPMPGGEEEQEEVPEEGGVFGLEEEAGERLWFGEEEEADLESLDEAFAELGDAPTCEAAWLMLMPALAGPALPKKRRAVAA